MQDISSFFDKFKKLISSDATQKNAVVLVIRDVFSIEIDPKSINIKNNIAYIPSNPILRSELLRKKQLVSERLKADPSTVGIKEIR
jgi:hypothetical protein